MESIVCISPRFICWCSNSHMWWHMKMGSLGDDVVQSLSCVPTLCDPWTAHQASLFPTISWSLPKFISIESVMSSNHLILCYPLLLLLSVFSIIRVSSNESVLRIRWPNYWSSSCRISPSNEYSGLISLKIDWFDLLAIQGTVKSLLQHHSSKASIFWCSAFLQSSSHNCRWSLAGP